MNYPYSSYYSTRSAYSVLSDKIYTEFRKQSDALLDQDKNACQAIDEWSSDLIAKIKDYTLEQKRLLRKSYENQRNYLDELRNEFINTGFIYQQKNNTEEVERLLEKCKTLSIELVKLKFISKDTSFIEVIPVDPKELIDDTNYNQYEAANVTLQASPGRSSEAESSIRNNYVDKSYSDSNPIISNQTNKTSTYTSDIPTHDNSISLVSNDTDYANNKCPFYNSYRQMKKYEQEIHSLFDGYCESLSNHKKKMSEKLIKWQNKLIYQINEHVAEQNKILVEYFEIEKDKLDNKRKQVLTDVTSRDMKHDKEQIRRLIIECKTLKLDLIKSHQYDQQMKYVRFMKAEELVKEQQENKIVRKTREGHSQKRSTDDTPDRIHNTAYNDYHAISLAELSSRNIKQAYARSSTYVILPDIKHPSVADKNVKIEIKNRNDTTDKCPLCFMIFPQNMKHVAREQHVNAHYT